jgi:hypothetical protein
MQKWEYLYLWVEDLKVISISRDVGFGMKDPEVPEYLNALGERGWELISITVDRTAGRNYHYFLKRSIQ